MPFLTAIKKVKKILSDEDRCIRNGVVVQDLSTNRSMVVDKKLESKVQKMQQEVEQAKTVLESADEGVYRLIERVPSGYYLLVKTAQNTIQCYTIDNQHGVDGYSLVRYAAMGYARLYQPLSIHQLVDKACEHNANHNAFVDILVKQNVLDEMVSKLV